MDVGTTAALQWHRMLSVPRPELLALHQISMDRQAVQHYYLRNDRQAVQQYTRSKTLRG